MFSLLPLVAILMSSFLSVNAVTYIGCTGDYNLGTSDQPTSARGNVGKCDGYCTTPYFYYRPLGEFCACSDATPNPQMYVQGESAQGGCSSDDYYQVYSRVTSFNFQGCAENMITDEAPPDVATLEECFAACANKGSAMFLPYYNENILQCRCNSDYTIEGETPKTCGPTVWFTYTHSPDASASGLSRRILRERSSIIRRESQTFCPKGAKACSIPGRGSYECIDTSSELESCGGCMSGEYHSSSNVTIGTDCSSLPGVARGAITCYNSQCEAFACKKGYQLASGLCVPIA
ncbi:hypothetical protein I302_101535 [Kwoniella bestiolae CBS 10118]|uniref:Protein CPL1-like domain-containing protein n=1 Tax=Kwoniella bestiolae CBS 10118 TaxID=1296100 RepID=A0A1B9GCI7_9TREE|nr:hypothetical protein I302_00219 [Kwoniella bestiolae CBS 10118]OCF28730.1 hypothetical protein I302_00219 [Kwoniella bestiolae CBS 10118]